jgi:thymidylate kinase
MHGEAESGKRLLELRMKKLIVFSGLDGAGKSTQISLLMETIRKQGLSPYYLWSRGGYTPFFNLLKGLIRLASFGLAIPQSGLSPRRERAFSKPWVQAAWLLIAIWDLILLYGIWIRLQKLLGKVVICDRYLWDTLVDFRLNFPALNIESWWLWKLLIRISPVPEVVFLMLIPVSESIRRSSFKGEPFRDSTQILTDRRKQYQELARQKHWVRLDGSQSIGILENLISKDVLA